MIKHVSWLDLHPHTRVVDVGTLLLMQWRRSSSFPLKLHTRVVVCVNESKLQERMSENLWGGLLQVIEREKSQFGPLWQACSSLVHVPSP